MAMVSQIVAWSVYAGICAAAAYFSLFLTIGYLKQVALAHPNHRSGHFAPTPQGAGLVMMPIVVVAVLAALWWTDFRLPSGAASLMAACAGALGLTLLGFLDDRKGIGIGLRLGMQAATVTAILLMLPADFRIATVAPLWLERALTFLAIVWFINATNFMDGMDWMSANETVAITGGVVLMAALGYVTDGLGWIAAALLGVMIGFMPWNAHPARLFLGDAGSLPLGLLLGFVLLNVAAQAPAAAVMLPLYYLADASLTLMRRVARGERFWQAHREHYYQIGLRNGRSVRQVNVWLGLLNTALLALALVAVHLNSKLEAMLIFTIAALVTLGVLIALSGRRFFKH
jgi:UDP-N-acetylmuramyl pentapeptide phosphotransferase/UDP-N-acetylglucosamine-1-phosphate transferase